MQEQTLRKLEELIVEDIDLLSSADVNAEEQTVLVKDIEKLLEVLTAAELANAKVLDDAERRRIDEARNESMGELERQKQKIDWPRWILEAAKIVVPVALPLVIWRKSFVEMVKFEETGRFTSSAARELRLPKIFNNK